MMPQDGQTPMDAVAAGLERGAAAFDAGDYARAGELFAAVAPMLAAEFAGPVWFDAALCQVHLRDWPAARELGLEAVRFVKRGRSEPAYWNLATAATALRDWELARDAWVGFGMEPLPGEGPIDFEGGPTCVRLSVNEVVWAVRIDPVRARICNVPFDPSRRFGEIVLHWGSPDGERVMGGHAYPVFNEIELFTPSDLATLSVQVVAGEPGDLESLATLFSEHDYGLEILQSRVDLCACCSAGSHVRERGSFEGEQQLFLGAPEAQARALLDDWAGARPAGRSWDDLHLA